MTALRLTYPLLFALIIAFLSMQWASAHIHLAENHVHDEIHQHEVESHTHHLTAQYSDTKGSSHLADTSSTIDLDNQCNVPSGPKKTPDLATIPPLFQQNTHVQTVKLELPFTENLFYHPLDRSAANPRAPPYSS